jgi:cobalamin biosynthetic protein CobC
LVIGAAALADRAWADATRIALANMARQLDEVLVTGGLAIAGGTGLFRFTHCRDAKGLHRKLALRHIWCRRFDEYDDRLRFGLPRSQQDLARLKDALESI